MKNGTKKSDKAKQVEIKFPNYKTIKNARLETAEKMMRSPIKDKANDIWDKPDPWYNH